jgi:hypothetical protein
VCNWTDEQRRERTKGMIIVRLQQNEPLGYAGTCLSLDQMSEDQIGLPVWELAQEVWPRTTKIAAVAAIR